MRHKRRGILEVNLTSLLDVLFCILFIVMMANIENEHDIKNESQQLIQEIQEQLQAEIAAYRAEAATYQAQMESYDVYHTEAIIITMQNLQEGSNYVLKIYEGLEKVESDSIRLGPNLSESVNRSIRRYFNDIINSLKSPEGLSVPIPSLGPRAAKGPLPPGRLWVFASRWQKWIEGGWVAQAVVPLKSCWVG